MPPGALLTRAPGFFALCYTAVVTGLSTVSADYAPDSSAEIQELVRDAIARSSALVPVGGGVQMARHGADEREQLVSTLALNGLIEYNPRDLVVVAQAGMRVAALQETLAAHGQHLPLEVALPERQTLGGVAAARAHSLTRAAYGGVRDWLIGCKVVGGDGEMISAGGKVVKNVAGYDLPKLYCGSWGSLGIITEVAFKLAPRPRAARCLLMSVSEERNSEELLDALARTAQPSFTVLLGLRAARRILGPDTPEAQFIAVGAEGDAAAVDAWVGNASAAAAPYVYQTIDLPEAVASRFRVGLRDLPAGDAPLRARCSILPSQVGAFARMLEWTARRAGFDATVFADAGAGTVWAHVFPKADADSEEEGFEEAIRLRWLRLLPDFRDKCERVGGSTYLEAMPASWRAAGVQPWTSDAAQRAWSARIKEQLDPHGVFAPLPY